MPQVAHTPNLVVTQTFSKVWGLAGLRLGYVVAHPQVIDWLKRVRSPYSVNTHAVQCALALLEKAPLVQQATLEAMDRKASLIDALQARGLQVKSQAANFFLLNLGLNAEPFGRFAAQHGVLVRSMAGRGPLLEGLVRISVGTEGEHQLLLQVLDAFFERSALVFDLDDTLIDTTQSFDAVVALLVRRHSDVPLGLQELHNLRAEGGFNDDWDATVALLARRGKALTYEEVKAEGQALYLKMASAVEEWRLPPEHLEALAQRYRLFLFTGRARVELDTIWGEALSPLFEAIYCSDDIAGLAKKPAPDYLHHITQTHGLHAPTCWYVGNSVDDMAAANAAGYQALGVVTTFSQAALQQAGAAVTLPCPQHLLESFACPPLPSTHV